MANEKLLPANVTLLLAYPEAFVNPAKPTAAELNAQFDFGANVGNMVFNVSCATLDDYTMNQSESDTDDTRTVCDEGEVSNATFMNYEVSLDFLRDESVTDAGIFNMAAELTRAPDRPFIAIKRIGKKQNAAFVVGDHISLFGVDTDYTQDIVEGGSLLAHGARFKPTGLIEVNYALEA